MKTKAFVGLGALSRHLKFGDVPTFNTMAIWCEAGGEKVSSERLRQIFERGMRKIRIHVSRELNLHEKEVLLDGIRLLSQTNVNLWDQQTRRLQ